MDLDFYSLDVGRDFFRFPVPIDQARRSCRTSELLYLTLIGWAKMLFGREEEIEKLSLNL